MRAHEAARVFFEQIRVRTYESLGTLPDHPSPALARDIAAWLLRENASVPGIQDPQLRASLEQLVELSEHLGLDEMMMEQLQSSQMDVEEALAYTYSVSSFESRRPYVGYLQTGQLNAVSMLVPSHPDAYLVAFHDELFRFIAILSEDFVLALPKRRFADTEGYAFQFSGRGVADRINANREIADRFIEHVLLYVATGSLKGARPYFPKLSRAGFSAGLRKAMTYFILGHEYAHVLLGHLDHPTRKSRSLVTGIEALDFSWRQEYDADSDGMFASINAGTDRGISISTSVLGICLFFDLIDLTGRAIALLGCGDENAYRLGSHPPALLRWNQLSDQLSELADRDPDNAESIRIALEQTKLQGDVINILWQCVRPVLLDLRERGVKVAPSWRANLKGYR